MGAIYGFRGRADDRIVARMGESLAHRGQGSPQHLRTRSSTLGYRAWSDASMQEAGLHHDGDFVIGLCGDAVLEDPKDPRPTSGKALLPRLLQAYRERGIEVVSQLRGAFVLIVGDADRLYLVRDGAGARTAYYGIHDGRFLFAIEPKGVLAVPGFPRRLRPAAVAQYLTFSFIPGQETMLADLFEVPAGHWVCSERPHEPQRYFVFERAESAHEQQPDAPVDEATAQRWTKRFADVFSDAVRERIPGDEPFGVFLSGGLDSSIVTAELAAHAQRPFPTYAIHFGAQYPNELEFARAVAQRCGTEHHEVLIEPRQFLQRLRRIIWHLDDPIGDPISVPNFELAARVSKDVRWVFNGEGGDPLFGGPKNLTMLLHHFYGGIDRPPGYRERCYLASYRRCYDDLSQLLHPDLRAQIDFSADLEGVLTPFFESCTPKLFLNKLMAINIRLKGAHLILPKVDRMLGAFRLRPLSPLFDERLIELSFAMPTRMKLDGGIEKIVLKRAFADKLPRSVIERPKSGMRVPVHFWFKDEMKRYARALLSPANVRRAGLFNPARVKQLLDYDIEDGPGRYGLRLWMLCTFEIWRRIVIEGEAV